MSRRTEHIVSWVWVALCVTVATYSALPSGRATPKPFEDTASVKSLAKRRIEEISVGDRVLGKNPKGAVAYEQPDARYWQHIQLTLTKPSGNDVHIELLRPNHWLEGKEARVGEQVFLDLPELGATGVATVKFIGPCPHIDAHAPGNLVTGTFKHEPDEPLLTITVAGSRQIEVGCTESHPFWSEDRQDFVPARDLRIGECLRTRTAGTVSILKIAPRPQEKVVYNLEVLGEHVYEVSELGILVHNAYNIKLGRSIHWSDLNPFQGKGWTEWQGWSTSFDPTKLDSEFPIALNETLTKVVQNKGTIYFNTRGVAGDTTEALQSFTRLRRTRSLADASGNSNNITTEYEWRAVIQDKDYRQYAKFVMSDGSVLDYSQYYDQILRHLPFEQTWGLPP